MLEGHRRKGFTRSTGAKTAQEDLLAYICKNSDSLAKSWREEAALGDGVLDSLSVSNGGKKIINAEISLARRCVTRVGECKKKRKICAAVDKRVE